MGILGDMVVRIKGDTGQLVQSLGTADKAVRKFSKLIMGAGAIGGAIMVFKQFGQAVTSVVKLISEQQEAEGRLSAAIRATGKEATISVASIASLANELQRTTTYGDEATISAAAMLQQLANLDEVGLRKLIPRVQNFAAAMGMDLNEAAKAVGKTLGSSTNALSRYGVQVDMSGSKTDKLNDILEQLDGRFAGMAEAIGQTTGGKLEILKNQFNDLKQELAMNLLPTINAVLQGLNDILGNVATFKSAKGLMTLEGFGLSIRNIETARSAIETLNKEIERSQSFIATRPRGGGREIEQERIKAMRERIKQIEVWIPLLEKQAKQTEDNAKAEQALVDAEEAAEEAAKKKFETTVEAVSTIGDHTDALEREYEALELTADEVANLNGMLFNLEQARQADIRATVEEVATIGDHTEMLQREYEAMELTADEIANLNGILFNLGQERRDKEEEAEKEHQSNLNQIRQAGWDFAGTLVSSLATINDNYYKGILDNENLTDEERKKIIRQQAKQQKAYSVFAAIVNTAEAVTKALSSAPPPFNAILAAISAAAGAVQIAAIKSQPLPKLGKGGKLMHPTMVMAGEAGPEYFIPELKLDELGGRIAEAMHNARITNTIVNDQPIQLSVNLGGRQLEAYIQEAISNRRILVREGAVTP